VFPDPLGEKHSLGYKHLALHLLVGAALSGGRVASLTKTDLEDSISGYGQEFCRLTKSQEKCQCIFECIFECPETSWQVENSDLVATSAACSIPHRFSVGGFPAEEMPDSPADHPQPLLTQEGSQSKSPSSLRRG
jgi:hypothetical protein